MKIFDPNLKFYKGNTHAHTTDSDGRATPEECMRQYKAAGYDFLAITDHWHVRGEGNYEGMLIVPGVEYDFSFPTQTLHLVCLFPDEKQSVGIRRDSTHKEAIRLVNAAGGVAIAAHPAWSLNTTEFLCSLDGVDIAEVYNTMSDEPYNAPRGNAESLLDVAAANGKLYNLAAADDSHFYQGEQCVSCVMVQAEALTVPAILNALRLGRFYASQGPQFKNIEVNGREIFVETSPVSTITFISNAFWIDDRCTHGENLTQTSYTARRGETYVRIQITDRDGKKAWSNPIALD
ncbi:MAG: CehA/McbA family metallohydrolase [Clostridia bacterium]|nr:CehA/McbA family metallohydrolase [Clostridia bacterium]